MKTIEEIFYSKKLAAIIFKAEAGINGTSFITKPDSPLQVGIHTSSVRKSTSKHRHGLLKSTKKMERHEVVLVQTGRVKITFYSKSGEQIAQKTLRPGWGVLIMNITHQLVLMPGTKIIEIKQGPYEIK